MVAKILEGDFKPESGNAQMYFKKGRFFLKNPDPSVTEKTEKDIYYDMSGVVELRWISEEPNKDLPGYGVMGGVGTVFGFVSGLIGGAGFVGSLGLGVVGLVLGLIMGSFGNTVYGALGGSTMKVVFGIQFHDGKRVLAQVSPRGWDDIVKAHDRFELWDR